MRHGKKFNKLSRTHAHRRQMLANMAVSLIMHKKISTTLAKAKALRMYVEPLLTKSKDDTTHSRRVVFSYLHNKEAVTELFREISQKIAQRPGGYTRILKTGYRLGDNAEMAIIELVDYSLNPGGQSKEASKAKGTRRSGKKKAAAEQPKTQDSQAEQAAETSPAEEAGEQVKNEGETKAE